MSAGTSTNGPITAAKAAPDWIPKTETATAMANSKLLLAAVKDGGQGCRPADARWLMVGKWEEEGAKRANLEKNGKGPVLWPPKLSSGVSAQFNLETLGIR